MLLLALVIASLMPVAAYAQSAPETPTDLWTQSVTLANEGDLQAANEALQHLLEVSASRGILRLTEFANAAAGLARSARDDGNGALSGWALDAARRLDPTSPDVRFAAADLASAQHNWGSVAGPLVRGIVNVFRNYSSSVISLSDFMLVLTFALVLVASALALTLLLAYGRCAAHDFRELFARKTRVGTATVLAFGALFLPIFLWLHPFALVPFWLMLFFAYGSPSERTVIVIALIALMLSPIVIDWSAYKIAGTENAIVDATDATLSHRYDPTAIQRIRDLASVVPENSRVQLILGSLLLQEGDSRDALIHFQKAAELDPLHAGTRLNIGNIHFLNEDFQAASVAYEKASQLDPEMAIAYYNDSVAAGEQYDFDRQGQRLELAKKADRSRIEKILAHPPASKIVNYAMPLDEAWSLASQLARNNDVRELFGQYAMFDPVRSAANPITIGSLLALVLGVGIWSRRRKNGVAGACVKCGRTFCYRCKSARESATYCTQCIHIYLKRDGVASEAKRRKVAEVQSYQKSGLQARKLMATLLPGSARILDGATFRGVLTLTFFLLFVVTAFFVGRLAPIATPANTMQLVLRLFSIIVALILWFAGTIPVYRQKVAG